MGSVSRMSGWTRILAGATAVTILATSASIDADAGVPRSLAVSAGSLASSAGLDLVSLSPFLALLFQAGIVCTQLCTHQGGHRYGWVAKTTCNLLIFNGRGERI